MRRFSKPEKEILYKLSKKDNLMFSELIVENIFDHKIIVDFKNKTVKIKYDSQARVLTNQEQIIFNSQSDKIYRHIFMITSLLIYFEKEGMIGTFRNNQNMDRFYIGNTKLDDIGTINDLFDENTKAIFLNYSDKILIINSGFKEFVKNGYISTNEKYQKLSIRIGWAGIAVAIATSILGLFFK